MAMTRIHGVFGVDGVGQPLLSVYHSVNELPVGTRGINSSQKTRSEVLFIVELGRCHGG